MMVCEFCGKTIPKVKMVKYTNFRQGAKIHIFDSEICKWNWIYAKRKKENK